MCDSEGDNQTKTDPPLPPFSTRTTEGVGPISKTTSEGQILSHIESPIVNNGDRVLSPIMVIGSKSCLTHRIHGRRQWTWVTKRQSPWLGVFCMRMGGKCVLSGDTIGRRRGPEGEGRDTTWVTLRSLGWKGMRRTNERFHGRGKICLKKWRK